MLPSPYWGEEKIWSQRANNHNGMFDKKGRVWFAAAVRGIDNPAFCTKGSDHPSAKVFPLERSGRQVSMLDPKTMKYSFVDTCFGTHHPQFGYDADDTLWLSGSGPVAGWVNTKVWDETGDAAKAQGWAPWVLDTNGNGKVDEWTEPGQPAQPGKDMRIAGSGPYAVMPHPTDGSVWYTFNVFVGPPGFLRFDPKTKLSEFYAVPKDFIGVRGGDIDKNGVLWGSGSNGALISFDRTQVQGTTQRTGGDRQPLPRRVRPAQVSGPGVRGFREHQRRGELLHLGRSPQHGRPGRQRSDLHRQPPGRLRGAQGRTDDPPARALPDGLLRQGAGWAHRRSRTPAGRAADCGARTATARRG